MRQLILADNYCKCCKGSGKIPHASVGFVLHVGDIVEDSCGLRVKIDKVWDKDPTVGWGTTINAFESWIVGPNHSDHRVETDNDLFTESEWEKVE